MASRRAADQNWPRRRSLNVCYWRKANGRNHNPCVGGSNPSSATSFLERVGQHVNIKSTRLSPLTAASIHSRMPENMSPLYPPKADMVRHNWDVRFVPIGDHRHRNKIEVIVASVRRTDKTDRPISSVGGTPFKRRSCDHGICPSRLPASYPRGGRVCVSLIRGTSPRLSDASGHHHRSVCGRRAR
jgi:hypothetical protein